MRNNANIKPASQKKAHNLKKKGHLNESDENKEKRKFQLKGSAEKSKENEFEVKTKHKRYMHHHFNSRNFAIARKTKNQCLKL